MAKENTAAIITVREAARMTPRGRQNIAAWFRRQASFLEKHGDNYAKRFTARYIYR